eukprot:CAMPEP_0182422954 /NCGR_PEP_ID=MMETSP1167-20130531/8820_1 /TAXON_ID=2988 /ORGANISM="Mallomonas Sp, Strain CCMP3275" /LENGTH=401 /DNA_ID=CAMNT_0024601481 /DNA_START=540 /DNA_END=1742 /DNA_ORIENTATION=-
MARRISGLLMHLQVFEIPKDTGLGDRTDEHEKPEEEKKDSEPLYDGTVKRVRVKMEKHDVPLLRIVGYDPKSRTKSSLVVDPRAVAEIAGGLYSQYLEVSRRRELARLVCESLTIIYPRGKPFELVAPWSGAGKDVGGGSSGDSNVLRSNTEKTLKRPGRIFRSGIVISHLDVIVTVFTSHLSRIDTSSKRRGSGDNTRQPSKYQIIINFYSMKASDSIEITLDERDQTSRIGRAILDYPIGAARATAIRHLCRFCKASLEPDPNNSEMKLLKIEFVPAKKEFLDDYRHVSAPDTGDDIRPVGAPIVFLPLDTVGEMLYRRGLIIPVVGRNGIITHKGKEYVVSVFTKTVKEGPERGLVVQLYDRSVPKTLAIHIGPSEIVRLCDNAHEPDLLHDMMSAKW